MWLEFLAQPSSRAGLVAAFDKCEVVGVGAALGLKDVKRFIARQQRVRFGRRRGSQPTVAMPSVAEAEPAEFAATAATLGPEIE